MPVPPETPRPRVRRAEGTAPLRRKSMAPLRPQSPLWRRALHYLLVFATAVLLADALVGERGLVATTRARRQSDELAATVGQLHHENARLRETAERLRTDPSTIESLARETLGLIRPGEVLVVVKDITSGKK
jgi:cell division protein FtsB